MKGFLSALATIATAGAFAQDSVIIRHPNGQPAVTARCQLSIKHETAAEFLQAMQDAEESRRRLTRSMGIAVPAEASDAVPRRHILLLTGLSCDGPVASYYEDGSLHVRTSFRAGSPNGEYVEYYPGGSVIQQGTITDGMITGEWTRYHRGARPQVTGRFAQPTPEQLRRIWESIRKNGQAENWEGVVHGVLAQPGLTREGLRSHKGSEADALRPWFAEFDLYVDKLPTNGIPDGPFVFNSPTGRRGAEVYFDSGVRTGTWTVFGEDGHMEARLDYHNGKLTHIATRTTMREAVDSFAADWRRAIDESAASRSVRPALKFANQMPEFPGDRNLFLIANLHYPESAKDAGIQGRVTVQFVVEEDGSLTNLKIIRGIGAGCDEEALRVVRAMPKWKPGKQNGKPVAVLYNLPIQFRME